MKTLMKCAITFALVLSALAAAAASASASSGLRLQPGGALTVTASGVLTFRSAGINLICNLNVTLALNSSISKVVGTTLGSIAGGTLSNCNDGSAGVLINLPVGLRYTSFAGVLPVGITGINAAAGPLLYRMSGGILYPPAPGGCQYTANLNWTFSGASNTITTFRFSGTSTAPAGCPTPVTIASSNFTLTGALRSVQIALV